MVVERIVPPGATLTYAIDGVAVNSIKVPEGRVRVTIEFGGATPLPRPRPRVGHRPGSAQDRINQKERLE